MAKCTHRDFEILDSDLIGFCTCKKCHERIWFPTAVNRLIDRVQRALTKLEASRKRGRN